MRALLYKHFVLDFHCWRTIGFLLPLFLLPGDFWQADLYTLPVFSVVLLGQFSVDARQGWYRQLAVLPFDARAIVGANYLFYSSLSLFLSLLFGLVRGFLSPPFSWAGLLCDGVSLLLPTLGLVLCFLPLVFYLGMDRLSHAIFAAVILDGFLFLTPSFLLDTLPTLSRALALLGLLAVLTPLSFLLAERVYRTHIRSFL